MNKVSDLSAEIKPFEWYEVVPSDEAIEQGDLLNNFPILKPPISLIEAAAEHSDLEPDAPYLEYNVIVLTQSCDLEFMPDYGIVILCPRYDLRKARTRKGNRLYNNNGWNHLRRGQYIGSHLINSCNMKDYEFFYQVVDFQTIFTVPYSHVREVANNQGNRVRLLPPYREHLAQAFARQFMRIGLPTDLPETFPASS
jgi:hypothetical protein